MVLNTNVLIFYIRIYCVQYNSNNRNSTSNSTRGEAEAVLTATGAPAVVHIVTVGASEAA